MYTSYANIIRCISEVISPQYSALASKSVHYHNKVTIIHIFILLISYYDQFLYTDISKKLVTSHSSSPHTFNSPNL